MPEDPLKPFQTFLKTLEKATNETQKREAFVILAAKGFADTDLATNLALAAEYQVKFKSSGLIRRGAIDAFYGNLVIEFEMDLGKTGDHALEQLQGYVAGAWTEDGTTDRPYLGVATDGARWEVLAPRLADASLPIAADNIELVPIESYIAAGPGDVGEFRGFLNRLFFRKTLLRPTTGNFARDFGTNSPAFVSAGTELEQKLKELSDDPQLAVLRKAWSALLQVSYGSVETDDLLFVKHTYLAVLARLLVWAAFEHRSLSATELDDVLTGKYFVGRRVANLVEDDFFRWYTIPSDTDADRLWIALSRHLAGYDLTAVGEDILKPLYEQLVDPEMRHDLGEYYTPDWLATIMTDHLLGRWDWEGEPGVPAVLDPTCGSGTFIRCILEMARVRCTATPPSDLLDLVLSKVIGIDVHPLAVIVARATYLLAIRDLIDHASRPITIPVFVANSLRIKRLTATASLFGDRLPLEIDGTQYMVPPEFIHESRVFDEAMEDVMAVAKGYGGSTGSLADVHKSVAARIGHRLDSFEDYEELIEVLGSMAKHIAQLIRDRKDSVHGFMLKNLNRPAMLRESFDFVIGNPPWLTVGDIGIPEYKSLVIQLATDAKIAPRAAGEQAHTEIATIFLSQAVSEFLRPGGEATDQRVALVMPRAVFSASHHRLLREGQYVTRFDVSEIWDLDGVSPLFNVPACVLFASVASPRPEAIKDGKVIAGRLPAKDAPWIITKPHLAITETKFELAYLGKRSAWRVVNPAKVRVLLAGTVGGARNDYKAVFRQGAILYPQRLIIVKADGPVLREVGTVRVRTDTEAAKTAKILAKATVNHVVDSANLYLTAVADHILPYTLAPDLWVALLPTLTDPGDKEFATVSSEQLRAAGRVDTAGWLDWAEKRWARQRKKGDTTPLHQRLDYLHHLSDQAHMKRYLVLYTASGKRPVAAVIDTSELPLPIVARDKTYWASFSSRREADYVAAFLNSEYVAAEIHDWMTRGLFGPRDIHKRVLDVPWPLFAPGKEHVELAVLSGRLAAEAHALLPSLPKMGVGRQRSWLRDRLDETRRARVEELVELISSSAPATRKRWA